MDRQPWCNKTASFSSSLLDAIYNSIDDDSGGKEPRDYSAPKKPAQEDVAALRRAIMVENWMESFSTKRFILRSSSFTDSSVSSDTGRSSHNAMIRARKKEPVSPCSKIAHFFNSVFSSRSSGEHTWRPIRKSRSMKGTTTTAAAATTTTTTTTMTMTTSALRSCLSKNPSTRGTKSKRAVRFCTVDEGVHGASACSAIGSQFIKKNIADLRLHDDESDNVRKRHDCSPNVHDDDMMSCSSSDLFELDNIGHAGLGEDTQELPVYRTTKVESKRAIA